MRRAAVAALSLILVCTAATPSLAKSRFPRFSAPVVDVAGVLDETTEAELDAELEDYQARTTNQIAVAIVDTTGDESIEDYTIDLAREWGVGVEDKDNGVLLLLAIDDRKMRIEVGRGLEGDLTDLESGRIIRDVLRPALQAGNYAEAVRNGVQAIRYTLGDTGVAPPPTAPPDDSPAGGIPWFLLLIGGISLASAFVTRGTRRRWGMGGPIIWGGGFGGGGGGFGGGGGGGFGGGGASGGW
jgi:uncharacterized protein